MVGHLFFLSFSLLFSKTGRKRGRGDLLNRREDDLSDGISMI